MGARAAQWVRQEFGLDLTVSRYAEVYTDFWNAPRTAEPEPKEPPPKTSSFSAPRLSSARSRRKRATRKGTRATDAGSWGHDDDGARPKSGHPGGAGRAPRRGAGPVDDVATAACGRNDRAGRNMPCALGARDGRPRSDPSRSCAHPGFVAAPHLLDAFRCRPMHRNIGRPGHRRPPRPEAVPPRRARLSAARRAEPSERGRSRCPAPPRENRLAGGRVRRRDARASARQCRRPH